MIEYNKHVDEAFDFDNIENHQENEEQDNFYGADTSYDNGVKEALSMIKQTKLSVYNTEDFEVKDNKLYYTRDFTQFYFTVNIVSSAVWNALNRDWIILEKILNECCPEGTKIHLNDVVSQDEDPVAIKIEPNTDNFPQILDFRRMSSIFALEDIRTFGFQVEMHIPAHINIDIKQVIFKNMNFWEIYNSREDPKGQKRYAVQRIDFYDCDGIHSALNKPGKPYEFNDAVFEGVEKPTIVNVFKDGSLVQSAKIVPVVTKNIKEIKFIPSSNGQVILENIDNCNMNNNLLNESFDFGDLEYSNDEETFFEADVNQPDFKSILSALNTDEYFIWDNFSEDLEVHNNKLYYGIDNYSGEITIDLSSYRNFYKNYKKLKNLLTSNGYNGKIHIKNIGQSKIKFPYIAIYSENRQHNNDLDYRDFFNIFECTEINETGFKLEVMLGGAVVKFKDMHINSIGVGSNNAVILENCTLDNYIVKDESALVIPNICTIYTRLCQDIRPYLTPTPYYVVIMDPGVSSDNLDFNKISQLYEKYSNNMNESFDFGDTNDFENDEDFFSADTTYINLEKIQQAINKSNICFEDGAQIVAKNNKLFLELNFNNDTTLGVFNLMPDFYTEYKKIKDLLMSNGSDKIKCKYAHPIYDNPEFYIGDEETPAAKLDYRDLGEIFDLGPLNDKGIDLFVCGLDKTVIKLKGLNIHNVTFESARIDETILVLEECVFTDGIFDKYCSTIAIVPKKYKIIYADETNDWIVVLDKNNQSAPTGLNLIKKLYNEFLNKTKIEINEKYSLISNNDDTSMTTLVDTIVEFIMDPAGMECDNNCHRKYEDSDEEFMWFTKKHLYNYAREKKLKFSMPEWMHNFEIYLEKNDDPDYAGAYTPEEDKFDEISQTICPTITITDGDYKKGRLHEIIMHEFRHAYDGWINHFKKGKTSREFIQDGYKCLETNKHMSDIEHTSLEPCPMYKEYNNKGVKFNDDIFKNEHYVYYMYCTIFYYTNFSEKGAYLESFTDIIRRQLNKKKEIILQEIDKAQNEKRALLDVVSVTPYSNSLFRKYKCYEYFLENPKKITVRAMSEDLIDKVTEQMVKQFNWVVDFEFDNWYDILEKANNDKLLPLVKSQIKKMQRIYFELIEELRHSDDEA